ncbi:MAG: response regulator [Verrucomicrobiales bacterium]|nr:response regulator [Verrucomicrobiales bacterium]
MNTSLRHRVLIIDDTLSIHEDIRKILRAQRTSDQALEDLESELFETTTKHQAPLQVDTESATQGAEGLLKLEQAAASNQPFALAIVDMRMPPGWDGIQTIQRLWEKDPTLQVVLCTAYSDYTWEEIVSKLAHPENLLILKKPFDNIELLQIVHALTRRWELARAAA